MNNVPALRSLITPNGVKLQEFAWDDHQYAGIFPYRLTDHLQKTMIRYGVVPPFTKIIDKSMGISTCRTCSARYAGQQNQCKIKYLFYKNSYRDKYLTEQEAISKRGFYDSKLYTAFEECDGIPTWDLQTEFSTQETFFYTMEKISNLIDHDDTYYLGGMTSITSGVMAFKDALPPGVAGIIEDRYFRKTVGEMAVRLDRHEQVLKEIAERMQAAGSNLLNGVNF